jgi:hypothetical protein
MLQRLLNQAVKLPSLLNRHDSIANLSDPMNFAAIAQLKNAFQKFIKGLWTWEVESEVQACRPLFWHRQPEHLSPPATNILWYPNIMTANSLTYCWAFEIIARVQLLVLDKAAAKTTQDPNSHTLSEPSIEPRHGRSVLSLAGMICDSMLYLMQPEFKLYGPGSAFFTLPTAVKVFQSDPDRFSAQLSRCQGIIDQLAGIGVFFPRIY